VSRQFDFLVAPFGGPVHASHQTRAVDTFEVAVAEAVPRLGLLPGPFQLRPRCHSAYSSQEWDSRKAFSAAARGCTSPQSLSTTYWRASMSLRALATAPSLSE